MKKKIKKVLVLAVIAFVVFVSVKFYFSDMYKTITSENEYVAQPVEEKTGVEEVKSRSSFKAHMQKIEDIEAKKIYLSEQKSKHTAELAQIEKDLESVRADELSFE